jgi:hypothetical protein
MIQSRTSGHLAVLYMNFALYILPSTKPRHTLSLVCSFSASTAAKGSDILLNVTQKWPNTAITSRIQPDVVVCNQGYA